MESFAILNFPLHLIKFDLQLCIPLIVSWRSKKKNKKTANKTHHQSSDFRWMFCYVHFFFCEPSVDETFHPFFFVFLIGIVVLTMVVKRMKGHKFAFFLDIRFFSLSFSPITLIAVHDVCSFGSRVMERSTQQKKNSHQLTGRRKHTGNVEGGLLGR